MAVPNTLLADLDPAVCSLDLNSSWPRLTSKEKRYAHLMSEAGWKGARIIMKQISPSSEAIHDLLISIYSEKPGELTDLDILFSRAGFDGEERKLCLQWSAQVFSNLSNYKSMGSTKFLPRIAKEKFETLVKVSPSPEISLALWSQVSEEIYSTTTSSLGKLSNGDINGYYFGPSVFTDEDAEVVQRILEANDIERENTRVEKLAEGKFRVWRASAEDSEEQVLLSGPDGVDVLLKHGDHSKELAAVNQFLAEAKKYAANDYQVSMIDHYLNSFRTGSIKEHVEGSKSWVKDAGPVVENYIGFIETYGDPYGSRAEWESFVAIVNKELSLKFEKMVDDAPTFIAELPWGKDFERENFIRPDYTALEIVNFTTAGIPLGINIPNYYSVRSEVGFKNVSLVNILNAKDPNQPYPFLHSDDVGFFKQWENEAFEVQVAIHELLGHGSGKLCTENEDGTFNFDKDEIINPITGKKGITSWYKPGQTPGSVLGSVSSSLEECRAEIIALYLSDNKKILEIFGHTTQEAQESIRIAMFLTMARAGLSGLLFYDPEKKQHGQAHMQARLGIMKRLLQDGIAILVEERTEADGKLLNAYVKIDRGACLKRGKESAARLCVQLQVLKGTADGAAARDFYTDLTTPHPQWLGDLREFVISNRPPRKLFVQPNTVLNTSTGEVELREYPTSCEGVIESFVARKL